MWVTFETAPRPDAQSVGLAGDFNGWNPAATPMKQRKDGCWWATLRLPKKVNPAADPRVVTGG